MTRVCFVCLGNSCRSPTAEAVFRHLVAEEALEGEIEVDSAGTGDWHVGDLPDPRAIEAAAGRGLRLESRARCFSSDDFERFDLVVAMDGSNRAKLLALAPTAEAAGKVVMLRDFDAEGGPGDVPDPYFGDHGFDLVLDLIESSCRRLLDHIRTSQAGD